MAEKEFLWLRDYFGLYRKTLFDEDVFKSLIAVKDLFKKTSSKGGKVILAGNGGSASIASHCAVDLTKNAGIRAISLTEPGMITCLANDFGYEHWMARLIDFYADLKDIVVLISSSGRSKNVLNAADLTKRKGLSLVTFSGFAMDNQLRKLGDINLWLDSRAYNIVEMTHHIWLLAVVDLIIGKAEYPAS